MGSDNTDVGNQTAPRKPGQPAKRPVADDAASGPRGENSSKVPDRICGAMSQQRGNSGHESAPQKFVQLVGYRDPNAPHEPWVRPTRPAAIKR